MRLCMEHSTQAIAAIKKARTMFEVISIKSGAFDFAATEAGARELARDRGWVDHMIIPPKDAVPA